MQFRIALAHMFNSYTFSLDEQIRIFLILHLKEIISNLLKIGLELTCISLRSLFGYR
jgi:hypothetical protein